MTLGDGLKSDRSFNLNVLRLVLAVSVIVSHAWPLALGPVAMEPLEEITSRSMGGWAVGVFFFISGVLITASAEGKSALTFWVARFRRIVPGLGAALLVTLALAMASGSTASLYQYAAWFFRAITLVSIEHSLPDAFSTNPYPLVVNGPLWSLVYEVAAYGVCAAFVSVGGEQSKIAIAALIATASMLCLLEDALPGRLATFGPLFLAFSLGMTAYLCRHRIVLKPVIGAGCLSMALLLPWNFAMGPAGGGLVVLLLCAPVLRLRQDVSYGLYIYGWPVAQTVVASYPGIEPLALAIWTLVFTYPLALASWRLVESPALSFRRAAS